MASSSSIPNRFEAPYMWVLGPFGDPEANGNDHWVYVGRYGSQYVHDERKITVEITDLDRARGSKIKTPFIEAATTLHIGTSMDGELVAENCVKEYVGVHKLLGNVAIETIPEELLYEALQASVVDTNIIYGSRQRLIMALASQVLGADDISKWFPPAIPVEGEMSLRPDQIQTARDEARPYTHALQRVIQ